MIKRNIKLNNISERGFVLLLAVVLSSIVLAVTLGVTNIAYKEIKFSTSAKDTNESFFAADVGVECALLYDRASGTPSNRFISPDPGGAMSCSGASFTPSLSGSSPIWSYSFIVPSLGASSQGCAKVTVTKDTSVPLSTIISKGYNLGGASCNSTSSSLVERELKVSY